MFKRLAALLLLAACSCTAFAQSTADWSTYRTDGHAKSNGVELTIQHPGDWMAMEGKGPHIVQQFISPDRRAFAMILVQGLDLSAGESVSQEEISALFQPSELKGLVPPSMEVIDAQPATVASLPAGMLEYKGKAQRAGVTVEQHAWTLVFIHGQSMIQLQFAVGGREGVDTPALMEKYRPLFMQMADSVVLADGGQQGAEAPAGR